MKNDELKALEDGQGITFTRKKRFNNGEKCNALQQPPLTHTHTNCSILGKLQMNRPLKGPCAAAGRLPGGLPDCLRELYIPKVVH